MGAVNNPPPISFSSQNVNSLNLTGSKANLDVKISSIKNLNTDVIFISDTRLVNCKGVSGEELVKTAIRDTKGKRYTPFFNSTKNSRGVGILLASEIDFVVNNTFKDQENANSKKANKQRPPKSLARKLVLFIKKIVQMQIASSKKVELWETSW